jgi:DNA-binding MarR family transcriptional regulator
MAKKLAPPKTRRLPPLLRRAWFGLNQAFRQRIAHLEITPDQYSLLRWIAEGDARGVSQRDLVTLLASDANTVASTLRRMEKIGLIEREEHDEDRRANRVRLKPAGKKKFAAAQKIAFDLQHEVLASLPAVRREKFLADLDVVASACQRATSTKKAG